MMTMPWTRADCAIGGYTGRTSRVFCGGLMLPPTRTGAAGGGGGGGGSGMPPVMPPATPPTIPPSIPEDRSKPASRPVSALISFGASSGAASGLTSIGGGGAFASGGGGGGGGAATNAIIDGGVGIMPVAINGTITRAATTVAWSNIVSGTVYHILLPILIDGSTTSPNISFGTYFLLNCVEQDRRLCLRPAQELNRVL